MRGLAAQLTVHTVVIDHVIAVHGAGTGLQIRRAVHMRDAQIAQVAGDRAGVVKGEAFVKLQPVGGVGDAWHARVKNLSVQGHGNASSKALR